MTDTNHDNRGALAPKLYQRTFDVLAADIERGVFADGARLTETGVAERFGVSRAPARQALLALERSGLVRKNGAKGYEVRAPDIVRSGRDPVGSEDSRIHFLPSWEILYPDIEIEIVSRTSLANWRINEAVLARHYGVSRTVARDVIARLQQRGVVQKDDKGRWYAPALTAKRVDELYELRWVLEPLALEKAFGSLPAALLPRLKANVEAAIASPEDVDGRMLDTLEQDLHVELLGYCDNGSLMRAIRLPQALLVAHHFLYRWTEEMFVTEPFLPEHLDIIDSLIAGEVTRAQGFLVHHLKVSRERAIHRIEAVAKIIAPADISYLERLDD
ncbi:GntR family transcriptional regulator [Ciceribacter sp. L1K23]|uniref:GntR family transcriptional regulator n=1 Tax=Ciceribacter sp. L1K23 TaxID=2820276 RepID=UPI001B83E02B|nr:GntR family transcriptional regulator [Ciceribacter sp. L1K23]MBR0557854.1 GntR family transcriptional regulator [Ciceribacter sp. L1K23]